MEANSQKKQMQICRLEEAILGSQCPRPPLSRASMLIAHNQVSHRLIPMMMVILMMLRKLNTGTYILKAKKFGESFFQSKKFMEKVRKSGRHFWAIWGNCGPFWVIFGPL